MRLRTYGRLLIGLVITYNVLFIVTAVALAYYTRKDVSWSWFVAQYPALFVYPALCGALTFAGFRISTVRITYRHKAEMAERLLSVLKSLRYEVTHEEPRWSVFKIRNTFRRIIPGFQDTILIHQGSAEFEVTAYREDAKVIEKVLSEY